MGIKDLWSILQPYSERKPLYELEGKIVAIDLSGWVCESLCVVDYLVQPRFYLRNLFFRTSYLLLSGVTPVFVLEGTAPPLKYGTICKRNETQFRGAKPRSETQQLKRLTNSKKQIPEKGRSRFNFVLKQCEELIASMGLQCVQGPGEAEAFCAYLNQDNMVDGVISQDSDCFAYGARRVYRNFSISTQGQNSALGGAVDIYDLDIVCKSMDFGQNKMVAMALLCGCDYCPEGVEGVGKDGALKLFNMYSEDDILERIKLWKVNSHKFTELELRVDDKNICVNCGHIGKLQNHTRNGCSSCGLHAGCNSSLWKEKRLLIKTELQIRKKALKIPDFPPQAVIDEFLKRPVNLPKLDLNWKQPNVVKFLKFMSNLLQWNEIYCFQKFFPLLTRWQLFHFGQEGGDKMQLKEYVVPDFIKKKRSPKGVASYEIIWTDKYKYFDGLIPDEQFNTFIEENPKCGIESLWSTIEPVDLVEKAYPEIVNRYLESIAKPKKAAKKTKKQTTEDNCDKVPKKIRKTKTATSATDKENKRVTKKKIPLTSEGNVLIENFFKKTKTCRKSKQFQPESPKIKTNPSPMNLSQFSIDFFNKTIEDDEHLNLSEVIRGIVQSAPDIIEINGRKLYYDEVNLSNLPQSNKSELGLSEINGQSMFYEDNYLINYIDAPKCEENSPNNSNFNKSTLGSQCPKFYCDDTIEPAITEQNQSNVIPIELDTNKDESFDEFDALVSNILKKSNNQNGASSTPVLKRKVPPVAKEQKIVALSQPSAGKSSYFFGDVTAENDLFEQSIDYKNMIDEFIE